MAAPKYFKSFEFENLHPGFLLENRNAGNFNEG